MASHRNQLKFKQINKKLLLAIQYLKDLIEGRWRGRGWCAAGERVSERDAHKEGEAAQVPPTTPQPDDEQFLLTALPEGAQDSAPLMRLSSLWKISHQSLFPRRFKVLGKSISLAKDESHDHF